MRKLLYIFNPWHDMALANFTPYYRIPSEVVRMSNDLSFLPVWYAQEDAYVRISDNNVISTFVSQVSSFIQFDTKRFVDSSLYSEIIPWGWSPALVYSLASEGVDTMILPDKDRLNRIRYLSGRQRCVDVLSYFSSVKGTCGRAYCCYSIDDVKTHLLTDGNIILKAPWSGSGRGLCKVSLSTWSTNIEGWISRILRTQGCIMAEPIYKKVCDFAMEFYSSADARVSFAGYSLFDTDAFGNYKRNILMSDSQIESHLLSYGISIELLHEVRGILTSVLGDMIAGCYSGYLGVDMMLCSQDESILLHPCVEINMRMNMGVLSRIIFDRYLSSSSQGYFIIEHYNSEGEAFLSHQKMFSSHPVALDSSGRIKSGYLTLTPVLSTTRYQAYLIVKE